MNRKRISLVILFFLITFFIYFIGFGLVSLRPPWVFWLFISIDLLLMTKVTRLVNNKIVWDKKIISFLFGLGILFVALFFLPSQSCESYDKYSAVRSCDCQGLIKNTSIFTTGCVGRRIKCYQRQSGTGDGSMLEVICPE
ncbi:MAG: hypothetical protein WC596_00225 [Candidatus Shapirobacteria bacterium]